MATKRDFLCGALVLSSSGFGDSGRVQSLATVWGSWWKKVCILLSGSIVLLNWFNFIVELHLWQSIDLNMMLLGCGFLWYSLVLNYTVSLSTVPVFFLDLL